MFSNADEDELWKEISEEGLDGILKRSVRVSQVIYKHSNRCGVCLFTKKEIESAVTEIEGEVDFYFLDVIQQRPVSNKIASRLGIEHESPQLIVIESGEAAWHVSHDDIQSDLIVERLTT